MLLYVYIIIIIYNIIGPSTSNLYVKWVFL